MKKLVFNARAKLNRILSYTNRKHYIRFVQETCLHMYFKWFGVPKHIREKDKEELAKLFENAT